MPFFRKVKIRARDGRGGGYDGMIEQLIDQYDAMKQEFDSSK